jgi:SAM-dependent methyltransferase
MKLVRLDPPGMWCVDYAFHEMLRRLADVRTFLEVGPGDGAMSRRLCARGFLGTGIESSEPILPFLRDNLKGFIDAGQYRVIPGNFMELKLHESFDVAFCVTVLEHIEDDVSFMRKMREVTRPGGMVIAVVPGRRDMWGFEDEISGHYRRYDRRDLIDTFQSAGLLNPTVWSLAVPVSNLLCGFSNAIIRRSSCAKRKELPLNAQTALSGFREIPLKNLYPHAFRAVLNRHVMLPIMHLQRLFYHSNLGTVMLGGAIVN